MVFAVFLTFMLEMCELVEAAGELMLLSWQAKRFIPKVYRHCLVGRCEDIRGRIGWSCVYLMRISSCESERGEGAKKIMNSTSKIDPKNNF